VTPFDFLSDLSGFGGKYPIEFNDYPAIGWIPEWYEVCASAYERNIPL
jgi:hypothetical protein